MKTLLLTFVIVLLVGEALSCPPPPTEAPDTQCCDPDPCDSATCAANPGATCKADDCDSCTAVFYDSDDNVVTC
ncbi:uncharacterized protein LOC144871590 isoform X2 [Branchiostoma floridae x Branchiostoma japonicum]